MGKFTAIPQSVFDELQINAGLILKDFDTVAGNFANEDILAATSGGIKIDITREFEDFGEDIDNAPKDTMELKRIKSTSVKMSGTYVQINEEIIMFLLAAAQKDVATGAIKPLADLDLSHFRDLWFVGDTSDNGFVAAKISNALSTGGFSLQTADKGKGKTAFEITGHVSINAQKVIPAEFYIESGASDSVSIYLNKTRASIVDGETDTLVATATDGATVTWSSSDTSVATVTSGGVVTAVDPGDCLIVAKATKNGKTDYASCMVTVTEAENEG
jgi:hypothetical protein